MVTMASITNFTRLSRQGGEGQPIGVATFFVSDWRYGAVVEAESTAYRNEYNRSEAIKRLQRFFRRAKAVVGQFADHSQYEGCIVALGGGMVDDSGCTDLEEQRKLRSEAVDAVLQELLDLRDVFGEVFVPCLALGRVRVMTRGKKTVQTFDTNSGDVAFFHELASKAEGLLGIEIDFQANKTRQFWSVYDSPFVMVNAAATFEVHPDTAEATLLAAARQRDFFVDSLREYRDEQQLEKLMLLFAQSSHSIAAPEQGLVGNASMVGLDSDRMGDGKSLTDSKPCWHCWVTHPGVGTAAVHKVLGVNVMSEDLEFARALPAISRWNEGQDKVDQKSNLTVVNFG